MLKFRTVVPPAAALLPWLWQLPYMISAWRSSPLDRRDWIFAALFPGLLIWVLAQLPPRTDSSQRSWHILLLPAAGALLTVPGFYFSVHMLAIAGSVFFAWGVFHAVLETDGKSALIFPFAVLALGTTSSTYWLSVLTGMPVFPVFLLKLAAAAVLTAAAVMRLRVHAEQVVFLAALGGALLYVFHPQPLTAAAPPLRPDFTVRPRRDSRLVGEQKPLSPEMRRFFRKSRVNFFLYADDRRSYQILEVHCPDDIHEIHPASHCLKSGGAAVLSENRAAYPIRGKTFMLLEITAVAPGRGREFHVVWYSDRRCSVSSFPAFRGRWRSGADWTFYQITTSCESSPESVRESVRSFLEEVTAPHGIP